MCTGLTILPCAAAQCSASTTTIQNQGDATALSGCTTFTGSIAIATNTANDISLDGVQSITGDLTAINAIGVTSISAGSLTNIGGTMQFVNMTVLNALNFPRLTTSHNIDWETLPALQGLGFTSGIQSTDILSIQDTQLQNLDGINPTTAGQIYISNNRYLTDINMQVANVTTNITIQSNNNGETNISFPNLVHATAMIVSQAAFLNFPTLQYVNGTMSIYSNAFTTFGCPNLTSTGGLSIATNRELTNISFPALTMVGMNGISIMDNQALTDTITFPVLTRIAGAITVAGDFTGLVLPLVLGILVTRANHPQCFAARNQADCWCFQHHFFRQHCEHVSTIYRYGYGPARWWRERRHSGSEQLQGGVWHCHSLWKLD